MISNSFLNKKILLFIVINSIVAIVLFFLFQKIYFLPGNDSSVFFYGPIIKNKIFKSKSSPDPNNFLLINTHYDNLLVEHYDEFGFPMGNISIVDREKLTTFFNKIKKQNSHKYIICDILFENKSSYDDSLYKVLKSINNIIIPRKDSLKSTLEPFRGLNSGLVDAFTVGGTFYKYKLLNRNLKLKSIPLKVYEDLNKTSISDYNLFCSLNKNLVFNDFVPENRLNSYNVLESNDYPIFNLGEIAEVTDNNFDSYINGKIIMIGNFNTDMKNTIYGNIPGPLIILNSYLALENQENKITFFLILTLFIIFTGFSYFIISPKDKIRTVLLKIPVIGGFLIGFGYVATMTVFSLIIYFVFGNNLNLTYIALIFYLENLIFHKAHYFNKFKEKIRFLKSY